MKKLIYLFYIVLLFTVNNSCQKVTDFATIYGVVSDYKTGDPIENAYIVISPGGADKTTGFNGYFEFKELDPQQYILTVSISGHKTEHEFITVYPNERKEKNIVLKNSE